MSAPLDPCEHRGVFGRMRLADDGQWETDAGARFHHYRMSEPGSRWCRTALGKLDAHLTKAGYRRDEAVRTTSGVRHVFRRGDDEIHVRTWAPDRGGPEERVHDVKRFPRGAAGTVRVTAADVARAMSFGMLGARAA